MQDGRQAVDFTFDTTGRKPFRRTDDGLDNEPSTADDVTDPQAPGDRAG